MPNSHERDHDREESIKKFVTFVSRQPDIAAKYKERLIRQAGTRERGPRATGAGTGDSDGSPGDFCAASLGAAARHIQPRESRRRSEPARSAAPAPIPGPHAPLGGATTARAALSPE